MELTNKLPKWLKILIALFLSIMIFADIYYIYLSNNAPTKETLTTINAGTLKGVEDDDAKNILTVRYFANADNSGVELFDFRLNYVTNAETTDVISVGIQLVGDSENPIKTKLNQIAHTSTDWVTTGIYWLLGGPIGLIGGVPQKIDYYTYEADFDADVYTYAMYDKLSYTPTSEIDNDSAFILPIEDGTTIKLSFRGEQTEECMTKSNGEKVEGSYANYNINYLVYKLFNSLGGSQLPYGTNGTYKFQFDENIFKYQQMTGDNVYTDIEDNTTIDKVVNNIVSYYSIKVETFERGALIASDSLFNSIKSQANFSVTDNIDIYNYHSRNQLVNLTENNFVFTQTGINTYVVSLTTATQKQLSMQSNATLDIVINLDKLGTQYATLTIEYDDYIKASNINSIKTKYTNSQGKIIYTEVTI